MRTDKNARLAQPRVGAAANLLNPSLDEKRLVRRVLEQRRADIQDERPRRVEPDVLAELFPRAGRTAAEPLVVTLCAGDGDPLGGNGMQLDRLALLGLVPDGDQIGRRAQHRLARQMVPAADAQHGAESERARTHVVLDLRRSEIDKGGDQHHVWLLFAVEGLEFAAPRHRQLELPEHPPQRPTASGTAEHRQARKPAYRLRRALLRAGLESRRRVVARIEKPQIVDPEPQLPRQLGPRTATAGPASSRPSHSDNARPAARPYPRRRALLRDRPTGEARGRARRAPRWPTRRAGGTRSGGRGTESS